MMHRTRSRARGLRRAAAVVEMALVTPLLLTMLFGIIEYGWVFTIKQTMTNAAREGCRAATLQDTTDTYITSVIKNYLCNTGQSTANYTITLVHGTTNDPTEKVTITVPYSKISLLGGFFGSTNWSLGSTCTMRKEGAN